VTLPTNMGKILNRFKKELIIMLCAILLVMGLSVYFMHNQTTQSLVNEHSNKLTTLKNALKVYIEDYFEMTHDILLSLSASQTTINAIQQFEQAFHDDPNDLINSKSYFDKPLLTHSIQEFLQQVSYDIPNAQQQQSIEQYIPESENAKRLLEYFVINTPFDKDQRFKLQDAKSGLSYDEVHKQYHHYFVDELQKYDFYDIFLIDATGNIIYTVYKEFDFTTNLLHGAYANSGLASVYKKAINSSQNSVAFEDFKPYEPSYNKPAAFIATPLYNTTGKLLGVLAIQLPITQLVKVMTLNDNQEEIGLGKSGESYLVGNDFYMRSDSRFIATITDPLVNKFATTVGITKVETHAVKQALRGIVSDELIVDYRGVSVYSSYTPIKVFDKQWAMLVEIDQQEVLESINKNTFILLLTSTLVFIIFISVIMYLFIKMILKPMQNNEELLSENLRLQNKALLTSETILAEYKKAVDLSAIVSKADKKGVITYVNEEFCKISGYPENELIGRPHNTVRHPDMPKSFFKELWNTLNKKMVWKGVIKNRKKDGGFYYVNSTIVPIFNENKEVQEFMSIRTDITDLILKEEQILRQTTDIVTGLPNRQKLMEDINELTKKTTLASIFIKNFRDINDFYTVEVANKIAKDISEIFQKLIHNKAIRLYRTTDNEFALMTYKSMSILDFENVIFSLIEYFDHNIISVDGNDLNISICVGCASGKKHRLFINSEMALRKAIEGTKSFISFEGNSEVEVQYQHNIVMTTKIKNAIKTNNILVFAQPISPNKKRGKQKYECLVRMRENNEIISPFFFLEISKKARLYQTITKIVIEKSFQYFSDKTGEFSINLTLEDILNDEIVTLLKQKIKEHQIGERLVIELVESEGIEEYENVHEFISVMKSMGCKIAIDDFGTGYSNFEYLMKLDADYIKIDGSLIKNIHIDQYAEMVVDLIVNFAKRMNMQIIAEYVHNEAVQKKVEAMGIHYSQGYYIEEPKELILDPE